LGLKEAKEAVEKLPNVLAKQATKEDAEKLSEALKKMGCTVVLKWLINKYEFNLFS